jgi:1-acyl-sn-glycerol-3-phosphate acyltransferase
MPMPDHEDPEFEAGATVELALDDLRRLLPIDPEHLREQLPGLEPERHVTDWGRSERVEAVVDRTLYDFLYHYWHRVEVEGVENVPLQGGALLVANHSGVFPSDGAMIAKAIRERHGRGRALQLATESHLAGLPGVGMLATKLGAVAAHPANLHRLLFDERQLVLVFPEGTHGVRKALGQRYRLRPFEGAAFAPIAIHARVPIVPVAVLGAEEALPRFGGLGPLKRLITGVGGIAITTGLPLPAKFRIRFLEPVETDGVDPASSGDPGFVDGLQNDIRALIQENLLELVAQRRSVWLG